MSPLTKGRWTIVLAAAWVGTGCFSEGPTEVAPTPDPLVVLQAVVRPDQPQQWVLLEKTFNGTGEDPTEYGVIPGSGVSIPVGAASVTMTNVSFDGDPCGPTPLTEAMAPTPRAQPGAYFSPPGCPTIRPGDTLTVTAIAESDTLRGQTIVPRLTAFDVSSAGASVSIPGPRIDFNRDADTLRFEVDGSDGRMLLVELGERRFGNDLAFLAHEHAQFWVDGTELSLPGDAPNLFEDFDEDVPIPPLFRAGRYYRVTTAWTDQNFMDQLRSQNSEITGRGYINSIEGGYGFFGSMIVGESTIRVVGDADEDHEGAFSMTGEIEGVPISLAVELYRNGETGSGAAEISGFFEGQWVFGTYDAWAPGTLDGNVLTLRLFQPTGGVTPEGDPEVLLWELRGALRVGADATLAVIVDGVQVGEVVVSPEPS